MAGPFQAFVDKGYVTVSTTQATDNQDSEEVIRLDFSGILRFESQFILPSNLSMKIRKSTLKPNCVDLMNQCSLQSVCLMMTEKMSRIVVCTRSLGSSTTLRSLRTPLRRSLGERRALAGVLFVL